LGRGLEPEKQTKSHKFGARRAPNKNFTWFKAGMLLKTNKTLTQCPTKKRTFAAIEPALSDILGKRSEGMQKSSLNWGSGNTHGANPSPTGKNLLWRAFRANRALP